MDSAGSAPLAWTKAQIETDSRWRVRLDQQEAAALRSLVSGDAVNLEATTIRIDHALGACGVALVSGLDVSGLSSDDCAVVLSRLGGRFGILLPQDAEGARVTHRRETGHCPMHTDGGDVAALLCVEAAEDGGATRLVNSRAIFEYVLGRDSDLTSLLFRPWHFDRRDRLGSAPTFQRPIFSRTESGVECFWLPNSLREAARHGIELSERESAALALMDEGTYAPHLMFSLVLRPGEILFFNNRVVIHGREDFENTGSEVRELVRVWIQLGG